jgi:hypothetical protein
MRGGGSGDVAEGKRSEEGETMEQQQRTTVRGDAEQEAGAAGGREGSCRSRKQSPARAGWGRDRVGTDGRRRMECCGELL